VVIEPTGQLVIVSERLGPITEVERQLATVGSRVETRALWSSLEVRRNAADADVVIIGAVEPFGRDELEALPRLRGIVRRGVGVDNVDVVAATELGIIVANVPDASVEEVSDHSLTLLLALERRINVLDSAVHNSGSGATAERIQEISSQSRRFVDLTLGVVGFGRIGKAMARKAQSVYGRVLISDPFLAPESIDASGVTFVPLSVLLGEADHVSLHLPLSDDTRNLIGKAELEIMKKESILVNCSRGGLVDEVALVAALQEKRLAAAGLDVTAIEPIPADHQLLKADGVTLTGHAAAWSITARRLLAVRSVQAAQMVLQGNMPASSVNANALGSRARQP